MNNRLKWLDTLKLIACMIVFTDHFYSCFFSSRPFFVKFFHTKIFHVLVNGNLAVCFFLMVSAYIAARQVYKHPDFLYIKNICFKRYFRFVIPISFLGIIIFIMKSTGCFYNGEIPALLGLSDKIVRFFKADLTLGIVIKELLINIWWKGSGLLNGPFWMLSILFKGYFFSVIISILTSHKNKYTLLLFAGLIIVSPFVDTYTLCFVLGVLIAHIDFYKVFNFNKPLPIEYLGIIVFIAGVFLPKFLVDIPFTTEVYFTSRYFFNTIGSTLILAGGLMSHKVQGLLERIPFTDILNPLSFAIYLIHWPLICSLSCWLVLKWYPSIHHKTLFFCFMYVITTLITFFLSWVYSEVIEKRISNKLVNAICKNYLSES